MADLLRLWHEAKAFDWQPTTARDHRSRVRLINRDIGTIRLLDVDPFRIDSWIAQMRRKGVGEGAVRSRVSALRAALSWGISRRILRSNAVTEAAPRLHYGHRTTRPDPEKVVALLAAAGDDGVRAALGLRLAAVSGARAAEVARAESLRCQLSRCRVPPARRHNGRPGRARAFGFARISTLIELPISLSRCSSSGPSV